MSVDELIDPPYFPALDKKYTNLKNAKVFYLVMGIFFVVIGVALLGLFSVIAGQIALDSLLVLGMGGLLILASRLSKKRLDKVDAELTAAVENYINTERNKLNAVKAKMNDAEWENYKLQLQNQKLLVQLNQKQNVRTRTTTTSSWVAEISD